MAAYYLPTLCTAPKPYLYACRHSGQLTISTAAACRRGASRIEAAAGDCTKHSAWTSIRQERWEGDLAVEGRIPEWLVRIHALPLCRGTEALGKGPLILDKGFTEGGSWQRTLGEF